MYVLAGLVITYAFAFLFMLFFKTIPAANKDIITTLSGIIVGSGFMAVINYFFGSTKGSADKTQMIANSQPIPTQTTATNDNQ